MNLAVRFSGLVRNGLRFRGKLDELKQSIGPAGFDWYPYDSIANLFPLQQMIRDSGYSLSAMIGNEGVLDLGAGDGTLSFFFESLGYRVHAFDHGPTNINHMQGMRLLAVRLGSSVQISDLDLNSYFTISGRYGLTLFLGILYHLKNPFYVLDALSAHSKFCVLSTRVARLSHDRTRILGDLPIAYLAGPNDCNSDSTNYWIFTPEGLRQLVDRTQWSICAAVSTGTKNSDPYSAEGDERQFLLLRSRQFPD